jgi:2-octaprenylphenol hydroxylase
MRSLDAEVIIAGGGPIGTVLAARLGLQGVKCILLDSRGRARPPDSTSDPRALALTHASTHILESINAWSRLPRDRIGHFRRMLVWDENGKGEIRFDSAEICEATLGYIVEQELLQAVLDQILEFIPAVRRISDQPAALHWHADAISVELADQRISAELLVAADGAHSATRELAGIGYAVHDYRQTAVACIVSTELPHQDTARQRFLTGGPLAFLPMAEPRQCGVVWSTEPGHAGSLLAMPADEFRLALGQAFDNTLGAITACGNRTGFPLQRAQAEHYCGERVVLIGDAAHSVHPLAGQGANLGLLDTACLAEVLLQARQSSRDLGKMRVLRRYARWRQGENRLLMMVFEGFKYLFENQSAPVPLLRNLGLNLVDQSTCLKHLIMRRAMGLAGDLPAAARRVAAGAA